MNYALILSQFWAGIALLAVDGAKTGAIIMSVLWLVSYIYVTWREEHEN